MRLAERTLTQVYLVRRVEKLGALGGLAEGFSEERIAVRASVLPADGGLSAEERGAVNRSRVHLLVAGDTAAAVGDGVWIGGVLWRILEARRWTAHTQWICEVVS